MKIGGIAPKDGRLALAGFAMLSLLLSHTASSFAQSNASIVGLVTDQNVAALADAKVTVSNVQTNVRGRWLLWISRCNDALILAVRPHQR